MAFSARIKGSYLSIDFFVCKILVFREEKAKKVLDIYPEFAILYNEIKA